MSVVFWYKWSVLSHFLFRATGHAFHSNFALRAHNRSNRCRGIAETGKRIRPAWMRFPVVYHLVNTVLQTVDGFALRKGLNIGNFGRLHNYYQCAIGGWKAAKAGCFAPKTSRFKSLINVYEHRFCKRWTAAVMMPFPNGWTAEKEQIKLECGRLDIYNVDGGACRRCSLIFCLQLKTDLCRPRAVGMLFLRCFYSVNNWISTQ